MTFEPEYDGTAFESSGGRPRPVLVVGVDGTPAAAAALRYAVDRMYPLRGEVHAVHAYRIGTQEEAEDAAREFVTETLADLSAATRAGVGLLVTAGLGEPAKVLLSAAHGADGVVVGASRFGDVATRLGRPVASCVVGTGCPVTVVPEGWQPVTTAQVPSQFTRKQGAGR